MTTFATIAALTGVLAAGIIYGTDVFCASCNGPRSPSSTMPP